MNWAYGITCVVERFGELLPRTVKSLAQAGFDRPRLFVDGLDKPGSHQERFPACEFTCRNPRIRAWGNWWLGMHELFIRNPDADRYGMFQDDFVCCKNLRIYLEKTTSREDGYFNLYTFPSNEQWNQEKHMPRLCPDGFKGWYPARATEEGPVYDNGIRSQSGRGAVGLVFGRKAMLALMGARHSIERPLDAVWGTKKIDGCVVASMNKAGFLEMVHSPSLIQHTGAVSSMRNMPHKLAESFPGEDFDPLKLLEK